MRPRAPRPQARLPHAQGVELKTEADWGDGSHCTPCDSSAQSDRGEGSSDSCGQAVCAVRAT